MKYFTYFSFSTSEERKRIIWKVCNSSWRL